MSSNGNYSKIEECLTVRGPSISGHVEGSARSPLPLYADYKSTNKVGKSMRWQKMMTEMEKLNNEISLLYHIEEASFFYLNLMWGNNLEL